MGGSGGNWIRTDPSRLASQVRKSENDAETAEFKTSLAQEFATLLSGYNDRNTDLVRDRLNDCKEAIGEIAEGSIDHIFGGSVAKNTYINGLSDIDSLILFDKAELRGIPPSKVLERMTDAIKARESDAKVSHGALAVTVDFPDGMSIQMLPAVRQADGNLRVPSSRGVDEWSSIDPQRFQEALTRRNQECGGKLVPTIKLAKAINATLPEAQKLSGYHIESLAIKAFKNYDGPKTTMDMLPKYFEDARELVKSPVRDSTGQSVHADGYLGEAGSAKRLAASHLLGAIAKRMRNATAATNIDRWRALFGVDA